MDNKNEVINGGNLYSNYGYDGMRRRVNFSTVVNRATTLRSGTIRDKKNLLAVR